MQGVMRNGYVIKSNRYDSHTIAAERNPSKYVILELFFQQALVPAKTIDAHTIVSSTKSICKKKETKQ